MRAPLLLLGGIVVFSVAVARALSCVCSPLECDVLTDEDCPGGLIWDPCRCCKVCARVEGEPCGGLFGFSGSCAVGLQCVIKNLLHHAREVDEGVCAKIPGRWRRHCPRGPIMSGPGCNLVGEGGTGETGNGMASGKCVCGPSVPWCPDEPPPYLYETRHECKLNLAAKMAYDDLFNSGDAASDDIEVSRAAETGQRVSIGEEPQRIACTPHLGDDCSESRIGGLDGAECPEDSIREENGSCKCSTECLPPPGCQPGQRPVQVRPADPETPGSCCPLFECKPSESVSWVRKPTEEVKPAGYCFYEGKARKLGERWEENACLSCVCDENGQPSCQAQMCKPCENAPPPDPGECCPHCPLPTNVTFDDSGASCRSSLDACRDLRCDHGFINDENNCPTCECAKRKDNDVVVDRVPPDGDTTCPESTDCGSNCDLVKDERGCSVCSCQPRINFDDPSNGTVVIDENGKKICPEVKCDLHCERGLVMDENDCTFCKCRESNADCPPLVGCRKRCNLGYKTNKRGCPMCRCRASCTDHLNETHPEGSTWNPNSCTTCSCEAGGKLSCKETICSVACSDPLPPKPGTCCAICPITPPKDNDAGHQGPRGWTTVPITLIVVLAVIVILLIVYTVCNGSRGQLSPSEASYSSCPPQYYKCVPAYDTPIHRNEKIVPL